MIEYRRINEIDEYLTMPAEPSVRLQIFFLLGNNLIKNLYNNNTRVLYTLPFDCSYLFHRCLVAENKIFSDNDGSQQWRNCPRFLSMPLVQKLDV